MAQWVNRFDNHPIFQALDDLDTALDSAQERASATPASLEALHRLRTVHGFVADALNHADSALIAPKALEHVRGQIDLTLTEVRNFISNGSPSHLDGANAQVDGLLPSLGQINAIRGPADLEGIRDNLKGFRQAVGQFLRYAQSDAEEGKRGVQQLRDAVAQVTRQLETVQAQLTAAAGEQQARFAEQQEARLRDFTESERQRQHEFVTAEAARTQQFESAHTEWGDKIAEQITAAEQVIRQADEKARDVFKTYVEAFKYDAEEAMTVIRAQRDEAVTLLGIIGDHGMTSGFRKVADQARTRAHWWQAGAVGAMVGLSVAVYFTFQPILGAETSWTAFASRVFISLSIGLLAGYAARQADRYHKIEQDNRRRELEFAALGPYLAPLDEEQQREFRFRLADRVFGRFDEASPSKPTPATLLDYLAVPENAGELARIRKLLSPGGGDA